MKHLSGENGSPSQNFCVGTLGDSVRKARKSLLIKYLILYLPQKSGFEFTML